MLRSLALSFLLTVLPVASAQTLTERVSIGLGGAEADAPSYFPEISANGRFVAFSSLASNLVAGDTNNASDIFVYDRTAATTERISIGNQGEQSNGINWRSSISGDGRFVAFTADSSLGATGAGPFVYVRDRAAGITRVAFDANQPTFWNLYPSLSLDGRYVAFNMPPAPNQLDLRLGWYDMIAGMLSVYTPGPNEPLVSGRFPSISGSGRYIAFECGTSETVLFDTHTTSFLARFTGRSPAFAFEDTYAVSTSQSFSTTDPSGTDIYAIDTATGSADRVSVPTGGDALNQASGTDHPSLSLNGLIVAFETDASNLGTADSNGLLDVYVRDRLLDITELISQSTFGVLGNGQSTDPSVSGDGRFVAFASGATNLVGSDTNGCADIFVRDRWFPLPSNYCVAKLNSQGCLPSIGYQGTPSRTGADDFFLTATAMRNQSVGLLIWGSGPDIVPFAGGIRCVRAPVIRTPPQQSGGSQPPIRDCTGSYSFHFSHALMQGYFLPPGTVVYAQYWQRDPPHPDGTGQGLSDGLRFTIWP